MNNIKEKVINNKFKKVYTIQDINNWIKFGIQNGYINRDNKTELIKWIQLLKDKNIEI
jgi:hypothetical protein